MILVRPSDRLITLLGLCNDVGFTGDRHEGREPVMMLNDLPCDLTGLDFAGPSHEQWNAESTFPVSALLTATSRSEMATAIFSSSLFPIKFTH